jgi:hypothetical protein
MNVPSVSFLISTNLVVVQVVVAIQALVAFLQNLGILKKKEKKTQLILLFEVIKCRLKPSCA